MNYINASSDHYLRGADAIYSSKNIFTNEEVMNATLAKFSKGSVKKISKDPAYVTAKKLVESFRNEINPVYANFKAEEDVLMKKYVKSRMELFPDKNYWPDANSTLRLTYGKAEGSSPRDGMSYSFYTTLSGIAAKNNSGGDDFEMPPKLRDLYTKKDYGKYANNGELRVCFTGSNHTTGGNSGSPVLNAYGELIGLNFDRSWESTMSDLHYDADICRNITVSINYVLFVIDKYAGAGHLVKEMNLVNSSDRVEVKSEKELQH